MCPYFIADRLLTQDLHVSMSAIHIASKCLLTSMATYLLKAESKISSHLYLRVIQSVQSMLNHSLYLVGGITIQLAFEMLNKL